MISPTFAALQPEAFSHQIDRLAPSTASNGGDESFESSLDAQISRRDDRSSQRVETRDDQRDYEPVAAQEDAQDAQKSPNDEGAAPLAESDDSTEANDNQDDAVVAEAASVDTANSTNEVVAGVTVSNLPVASSPEVNQAAPNVAPDSEHQRTPQQVNPQSTQTVNAAPAVGEEQPSTGAAPTGQPTIETPAAASTESQASPVVAESQPQPSDARQRDRQVNLRPTSESIDSAAAPDAESEAKSPIRVNPVDATQSSPEVTGRAGDRASGIDAIARLTSSNQGAVSQTEGSAENRVFEAQVTRGLEAAIRQNGGSVTLRLKPETLGSLKIDLQITQGQVAAQLEATTAEARELLGKNLSTLRAALEAKGLTVRSVEVMVPPAPAGSESNADFSRSFSGQSDAQMNDAHKEANEQSSSRREDPGGATWNEHGADLLAEDELIEGAWDRVYVNGSLNAIA